METALPRNEARRLQVLRDYDILDTLPEQSYDDLVALAAAICETPIAAISLVDETRQWFKSKIGLTAQETTRQVSFCAHALSGPDLLQVPDATKDARFADNPLVTSAPDIRFYAGAPLITPSGDILGALCVIDRTPRELNEKQRLALQVLSQQAVMQMEMRRRISHDELITEQLLESQKKLTAGEERYRLLFERSPFAEWVYDLETLRFLAVNDTAVATYGYSRNEFLEMTIKDIHPIGDVPALLAEIKSRSTSLNGDKPSIWTHLTKEGSRLLIETTSHALDFLGKAARLVQAQDVTQRRQVEENQYLLRVAGTMARIGGWSIEMPDRRLSWSDEIYQFLEVPRSYKLIVEKTYDFFDPEARTTVANYVEACATEGTPFEFELPMTTGKRRKIWAQIIGEAVRDPSGQITRVQGALQDVTQSKQSLQRLSEQAALLDNAHEGIIIKNMQQEIIYWNKGAEHLFGWTAKEAVGSKPYDLLYVDPADYHKAYAELLVKGEYQGEIVKRSKEGQKLIVETRWSLIRDEKGQPKSVLVINADISEKKKLEAQFLRAQRMEGIGTLASGIAHDLNNILAPILMSLEVLKMRYPDPEADSLLDNLRTSAQRGADLVGQVLSFARGVESQRLAVHLMHVLRDIQKIVQDTFPKSIAFDIAVAPDLWTVEGDPTQIHQVFLNLCVNARDAMPQGGKITIEVKNKVLDETYTAMNPGSLPGSYVMINVTDTGTGIPPEVREKIFEPFFTTKEIGKGTGLGLSTTLGIIKSHKGFINLYSEIDRGTTFTIYLPAETSAAAATEVAIEQTRLPRGNGELILVIDDEQAIRVAVKSTLERFGYTVILANNGAEAIATYLRQQKEIAAVLTDMAMPIMDGPATITALYSINPDVKILGSSGLSVNSQIAKAMGAGLTHFVPKPYTAETLLKKLRQILE